jgi:4-alpha-glucanotransferase
MMLSSAKNDAMRRGSGILLHITSLPSRFGIGDAGPGACKFIDFLAGANQSYWQVLPLNPTSNGEANSPYSSSSAFAGNDNLISPELLVRDGYLSPESISSSPSFPNDQVDYETAISFKCNLLDQAFDNFKNWNDRSGYEKFSAENSYWLDDFALFVALKEHFKEQSWGEWPPEIKNREPKALSAYSEKLLERIEKEKFWQYIFFSQWMETKNYAHKHDIKIVGDLPIYMSHQSSDVWAHPELFKLDDQKKPVFLSGVPPDYFSKTGQLWGNPVYNWDRIKATGFDWWIRRVRQNLTLCDLLRIDHFRGLAGYWEVPAGEKTAINGKWVTAPGTEFFSALTGFIPTLPIIAEDLGTITPDVKELMNKFGIPGMKVLLFAFGGVLAENPYLPHNHIKNCLVYTGTHDNNTIRGWYENEATDDEKENLARYLGWTPGPDNIHWTLIRLAMMSVADMVLISMQDILGLGSEARLNIPSTTQGNWKWRLDGTQLTEAISSRLKDMTLTYGRAPNKNEPLNS